MLNKLPEHTSYFSDLEEINNSIGDYLLQSYSGELTNPEHKKWLHEIAREILDNCRVLFSLCLRECVLETETAQLKAEVSSYVSNNTPFSNIHHEWKKIIEHFRSFHSLSDTAVTQLRPSVSRPSYSSLSSAYHMSIDSSSAVKINDLFTTAPLEGVQELVHIILESDRYSASWYEIYNFALAYNLAKKFHRPQQRVSGERYFDHIKSVVHILHQEVSPGMEISMNDFIIACLHDTIEDTPVTSTILGELFGEYVAQGVQQLSKKEYHEFLSPDEKKELETLDTALAVKNAIIRKAKAQRDESYFGHLGEINLSYLAVKIADRLHNLRSLIKDGKAVKKIEKLEEQVFQVRHYFFGALVRHLEIINKKLVDTHTPPGREGLHQTKKMLCWRLMLLQNEVNAITLYMESNAKKEISDVLKRKSS